MSNALKLVSFHHSRFYTLIATCWSRGAVDGCKQQVNSKHSYLAEISIKQSTGNKKKTLYTHYCLAPKATAQLALAGFSHCILLRFWGIGVRGRATGNLGPIKFLQVHKGYYL